MTNTILKHIAAEDLIDTPAEVVAPKTPSLTALRVTKAVDYLKWIGVNPVPLAQAEYAGKSYKEIAKACSLLPSQVKALHAEYHEAKVIAAEQVASAEEVVEEPAEEEAA